VSGWSRNRQWTVSWTFLETHWVPIGKSIRTLCNNAGCAEVRGSIRFSTGDFEWQYAAESAAAFDSWSLTLWYQQNKTLHYSDADFKSSLRRGRVPSR